MILQDWGLVLGIMFGVIVLIQLFFYWFFFSKLAFFKVTEPNITQTHPVSVIICARDEAANLEANIPAILNQSYPFTYEIVIVNDNSYDDTKSIIEDFKKQHKNIIAIHLTDEAKFLQGKKFPLSMGIKAVQHELMLLTDADCTPASADWLNIMQSHFSTNHDIVLGYGAYKKRKGFLNKLIRFETFHTALQYLSYALAGIPYMGVGRNLAYKKSTYTKVKGFAAHATIPSGDDDLFVNQVATPKNVAVSLHPNSFTYSKPKTTWAEWRKQKSRHFSTGKYYKPKHKFLLALYSISQALFFPLLIMAALSNAYQLTLISVVGSLGLLRYISLIIIWFKTMNKLNERDLKPYFWLWDLWLPLYFIKFFPSIFKTVQRQWK